MKDTKDLIAQVQSVHPEYKKDDVAIVIHAAIRALGSLLGQAEKVRLQGVGTFRPSMRSTRNMRWPIKNWHYYFSKDTQVTRSLKRLVWPDNKEAIYERRKHNKALREQRRQEWLATLTPEERETYEQRREQFLKKRTEKRNAALQKRGRTTVP